MYFDNAPFFPVIGTLQISDYRMLQNKIKEIFLKNIPTAKTVRFIHEDEFGDFPLEISKKQRKQIITSIYRKKIAACVFPNSILFPLKTNDQTRLAALVSGIDAVVVERASSEWLEEILTHVENEILTVKEAAIDPLTSEYNGSFFSDFISHIGWQEDSHLVLVESLPQARSAKAAFNHVQRTAGLIKEYNRFSFPFFHIGQSVFALIITDRNHDFAKTFCLALTSFIRNGGGRRGHVGFSSFDGHRHGHEASEKICQKIIDEAWHALHKASTRGPFAFCDYDLLANPNHFPLQSLSKSSLATLSYRLKKKTTFSLVVLKPDFNTRDILDNTVLKYLNNENYVVDSTGYVVIRDEESDKAHGWAESLIGKIKKDNDESNLMSAGVSSFPFYNYAKSEIVKNCMKALLHGSFFGPGSAVIYDSLSLNVSGDAYYAEGDFAGAIKEYRKGLELAENDINLLNSLGVTYGFMNRTPQALTAFSKVLAIESDNFMALYNKGLGEQAIGDHLSAVYSYSSALESVNKKDKEELAALSDLQFQLGLCYYNIKDYKNCTKILRKWFKENKDNKNSLRCCRYIGISSYYLKNMVQASQWLQRGLSDDGADAESLSLLGEIYLKGKEGDEIALKLCEKSVEIDPNNVMLLLRYARALSACGHQEQALEILKQCVRKNNVKAESLLEMAEIYLKQNEISKCRQCLKKVLALQNISTAFQSKAKRLYKKLQ